MVLQQLGALRFAGLFSDFGSLPLDANLNGAIFDAVDTVQKWVFDGSAWTEFLGDTSGEDNTGANVGIGTGLIFRDKSGVTLNFKSLIGGANITVTDNADDITLSSTGTSPLTTKGDVFGFSTLDARLPVGTDGQVLSANDLAASGLGIEWVDAPSSSPLTTKGDLVGFSTLDVRIPVGTDDQVLTADTTAVEGVRWKDSAGGGGGITGLNPNSTILDYSTTITDYTTPTSATATSGTPANAIDGNTTTFWASDQGIAESITLDMGSVQNCYGLAYYISTAELATMTETQFQIKTLPVGVAVTELKSYWKFDEASGDIINQATTVGSIDGLGSGADLQNTALTYSEAGIIGTSVRYNGSTSKSIAGSSLSQYNFMHNTTGLFTVCAWIKYSGTPVTTIFASHGGSTNDTGIAITFSAGNTMNLTIHNGQSGQQVVNAGTITNVIPNDSNFHFLVITWDQSLVDTNLSIQVDNATAETFNKTANVPSSGDASFAMTFMAGANSGQFSAGNLDEFSIFNRVLSPQEITELYNSGAGKILGGAVIPAKVLRTINKTDLVPDEYNFIRFNGAHEQFIRIEGSSGNSLVMAANELAVQTELDPPLTTLHGQFTINGTNANLPLNGGDPTSSVIEDPQVNSLKFNNVGTQGDPAAGQGVMWVETVDANNDGIFARIKIDGIFQTVRVV